MPKARWRVQTIFLTYCAVLIVWRSFAASSLLARPSSLILSANPERRGWASGEADSEMINPGPIRPGILMEPRILVLSASVGAGHLRAAEAVDTALRQV